jgi:hypothetical protein
LLDLGGIWFPIDVGFEFSFMASLSSLKEENKELYDSKLSSEASLLAGFSEETIISGERKNEWH